MDILVQIDCLLDKHRKLVVAGEADGLAQIACELAEKLTSATALLEGSTTPFQRQQLVRMREKTVSIGHLVRLRLGNTQRAIAAFETTGGDSSGPLYASAGQMVSRLRQTTSKICA